MNFGISTQPTTIHCPCGHDFSAEQYSEHADSCPQFQALPHELKMITEKFVRSAGVFQ